MKYKTSETLINSMGVEVYPITLIKFLLNKRKILSYFQNLKKENFIIKFKQTLSTENCEMCQKLSGDKVCRNHTSIKRVMNANNVLYDLDTKIYFYRNEIFRMIDNKLVVIYCPHPKMITGVINDEKVRKINPVTVVDPELSELPYYEKVYNFNSEDLMPQHIKCWFNRDFSIMTIPKDFNGHDWCLTPNN